MNCHTRKELSKKAKPGVYGNVIQFPKRIKKTLTIDDPLNTDTYPSMEAAMVAFISASNIAPNKEDRKILEQLFIENGLSRRYVIDLAFDAQREVKAD